MTTKDKTIQESEAEVGDAPVAGYDFSAMTKDELAKFAATIGRKLDLRKPIEQLVAQCERWSVGEDRETPKAGRGPALPTSIPAAHRYAKNTKTGVIHPVSLPLYRRIIKRGGDGFYFCDKSGKRVTA